MSLESLNTNWKTWICQKKRKQKNEKKSAFTIVKVAEKEEKRRFNLDGLYHSCFSYLSNLTEK